MQHAAAIAVHEPDHLRRALLQEHRRGGVLRSVRRHRRRHRLVSGARAIRTTTSRTTSSRTINHQLVTEVAEDDGGDADAAGVEPVAAEGPEGGSFRGRHRDAVVDAEPGDGRDWLPRGVWSGSKPDAQQVRVVKPTATMTDITPGTVVSVKAVNAKGLEGWDWARVTVR